MQQFTFKEHTIQVYWVTGVVVDVNERVETHIHSTGGGGRLHRGSGKIDQVNISSSNTHHKEVFLQDATGLQHPITLTGWNVSFIRGNTLTVAWLIRQGENHGPYVLVHNHSTQTKVWGLQGLLPFARHDMVKCAGYGAAAMGFVGIINFGFTGTLVCAALGALMGLVFRYATHRESDAEAIRQKVLGILAKA